MAGITLEQAEQNLAEALTALSNARGLKSAERVGKRTVNHDLGEYRKEVQYWSAMVNRLSSHGGNIATVEVIPR